jgi:3-hydroxymyristoyl/3-hydroxydecanoyl-(acyl carrier protein) dehydratase
VKDDDNMILQRCGGNRDWPGGRNEAEIKPPGDAHAVDVVRRIPHKGPMRFLRGTAWLDDKKGILAMRLPRRGVFTARDGTVIPLVLVEMLAQLCAARQAYDLGSPDGSTVHGYLVGMDHVQFRKPVAVGDPLRLIVWKILEMNEISRVEGEAFRGSELVARAELTLIKAETWFPPEDAAADEASPAADARIPFPGGVSDRMGRGILRAVRRFEIEADGALRAVLRFDPDFVGFDGHFPGHPVVPGVGLVYAGLLLAEIGLGRNLVFRSLKRARFLKLVRPSVPLDVQVRISPGEVNSGIAAAVNILLGGKAAAKFEFGADAARGGGR